MHIKNNYHKVLGVVYLVLIFAAIVSLIYQWQVSNYDQVTFLPVSDSKKIVYTNEQYNIGFDYRKGFKLDTSDVATNYFQKDGKTLVNVNIPEGAYSNTNLNTAMFTLALKENTTAADCQMYVTSANITKKINQTVKMEPGTFYVDTFTGAVAGTRYKTEVYRMFREGRCYEANLTVGIANMANFEPGSVKEVVEADVWNDLSCMLVSLKFDVH